MAERPQSLGDRLLASGGPWSAMPVEWRPGGESADEALPGWAWRVGKTLAALVRRPHRSFAEVQEPVSHGAVLALLGTVRLPFWALVVVALGLRVSLGASDAAALRPIYDLLDARLAGVLSLWILLMVPVGLPLLYFFGGLLTHVALALTGGAPRSIGATMRANGYALALPMIGVALADLPLYLGLLGPIGGSLPYLAVVGLLALVYFHQLGQALGGTHGIPRLRGFLVALVPVALFAGVTLGRALLELPDLPGWQPAPIASYVIP
ncbi:MAG TPA: hypothetical protein PKW35_05630 [Nannocystaceae bacterium]|nr:hypothetical protein [Nannocystaceae bacterium]